MIKNIVVLVSGGGTNLQAIIDSINNGLITNAKISLVISSSPTAFALIRAKNDKIDTMVISSKNFDNKNDYDNAIIDTLKRYDADIIVLAGFMSILSKRVTDEFANKIINVHPSLIPSFCGEGFYGIKVHNAVINAGVKVSGATVHFVNEIPDGGAIILQDCVKVLDTDTPEVLQKRIMEEVEQKILPKAVDLLANNKIKVINNKTVIEE